MRAGEGAIAGKHTDCAFPVVMLFWPFSAHVPVSVAAQKLKLPSRVKRAQSCTGVPVARDRLPMSALNRNVAEPGVSDEMPPASAGPVPLAALKAIVEYCTRSSPLPPNIPPPAYSATLVLTVLLAIMVSDRNGAVGNVSDNPGKARPPPRAA